MKYERVHDAKAVRSTISALIRRSKLSAAEIAESMSKVLGIPVTERMLRSFTADSKELHRWPAEFDIAFCEVIGNYTLLAERIKRAGFRMIGPNEERLLSIGRAWEQKCRAELILNRGGK